MMEFRALNNFARATGEGLREKVDMAIPDSILDIWFNQNLDDPMDNEPFLQATYRAGIQVENKKSAQASQGGHESHNSNAGQRGKKGRIEQGES